MDNDNERMTDEEIEPIEPSTVEPRLEVSEAPPEDGPKYPGITVEIIGQDGNVFNLLAICKTAMRRNRIQSQWPEFHKEATSGDYDHALQTIMAWFNVE